MKWTDPVKRFVAPPHGFRPRKAPYDFGHDRRDHLDRGPAVFCDLRHIEIALFIRLDLGFVDGCEPNRTQKASDRGLGGPDARALLLFPDIGLLDWNSFDCERKAPRCNEHLCTLVAKAGINEPAGDELAQVVRCARLLRLAPRPLALIVWGARYLLPAPA